MSLDNSLFIAPFAPEKADGDTFIYTLRCWTGVGKKAIMAIG